MLQVRKGVKAVEGISDLRIIGVDERRPPIIRKEPYIDIYFKLSHKAPADWCNALNSMLKKHSCEARIKEEEGLYIETWVRTTDEIVALLTLLKDKIKNCSRQYIERIELAARNAVAANASLSNESGEQVRLNKIIAGLNFDE